MKNTLSLILFFCLFAFYGVEASAADSTTSKKDPSLEFLTIKNSDNSRSLKLSLGVTINKESFPVINTVINFYTGSNLDISLGSAVTDRKGIAICTIPASFKVPVDAAGKMTFKAEFTGNDTISGSEEQLQVKDLILEATFDDADSIKKISICGYSFNGSIKIPLSNEIVNVYIPRMFSMYKMAEVKLDSFGNASVEFPSDLPGDSVGNLKIIVRLDDHSDFGSVEKFEIKKWGTPTSLKYLPTHRALWTAVAPWWMIISLTIMLVGVWAHYLYVIFKLIIISRKGKEKKEIKIY
jgi:hypothetical protein